MEAQPIFPILTTERLNLVEIQQKHLNDIFFAETGIHDVRWRG